MLNKIFVESWSTESMTRCGCNRHNFTFFERFHLCPEFINWFCENHIGICVDCSTCLTLNDIFWKKLKIQNVVYRFTKEHRSQKTEWSTWLVPTFPFLDKILRKLRIINCLNGIFHALLNMVRPALQFAWNKLFSMPKFENHLYLRKVVPYLLLWKHEYEVVDEQTTQLTWSLSNSGPEASLYLWYPR